MPSRASLIDQIESVPRRELYFFSLYRVLVAGLVAALVFSPLATLVGQPRSASLAQDVAVLYLILATLLLMWGRDERWLKPIVITSVIADIVAAALAIHAMPTASAGIAMMLLFNVAAAATLLPLRDGLTLAALASTATILEYVWVQLKGGDPGRSLAELVMFVISYLALAHICHQIGQRARTNQALAERRAAQVTDLYEINELIIRRMRTGVLVIDPDSRIVVANEAAGALLGDTAKSAANAMLKLDAVAPQLFQRLRQWRNDAPLDGAPLRLSPDQPEIQPHFVRLLANRELTLIFLDDTSVVSRRAESLTLSTMGRFSASLAHEIRNPLAAINYATQLLEESRDLSDTDRRLLQIIHQQCQRTNSIVENVLGLARRERASPEHLDLVAFVRQFVQEYRQTLPLETDQLEATADRPTVQALVDPRHLQQILTTLVHNALQYGRTQELPARVGLRVSLRERTPTVEVSDHGPGIPEAVAAQLFRPFFTTSELGTGLGLYIASELCRANQARLEYVAVPAGGACFRVSLTGPRALQAD